MKNTVAPTQPSRTFESLRVWQSARRLNLETYKLTSKYPKSEQFGLISQIRRASISVSSNIAEAYGRTHQKDKERFYVIALGSLSELLSQLILSQDLTYITSEQLANIRRMHSKTKVLLLALLKAHRS